MNTRQVILAAVVLGVTAAAIVWWLESFNRERLKADWLSFVESWERLAPGTAAE